MLAIAPTGLSVFLSIRHAFAPERRAIVGIAVRTVSRRAGNTRRLASVITGIYRAFVGRSIGCASLAMN